MPLRQIIYHNNGKSEEPLFLEVTDSPRMRTKPLSNLRQNRKKITIGILSDFLQEPLVQAVNIAASSLNLSLEIFPFTIETIESSILDPDHGIYAEKIDILMVYPDYLKSISVAGYVNEEQGDEAKNINKAFEKWANLISTFTTQSQVPVIIHNAPDFTSKSHREYFRELNSLFASNKFINCHWVDLEVLSQNRAPWFDHRLLEIARFPFAVENLNFYAGELTAVLREILHKPIKVVVTDLDNTLWDGILGEQELGNFGKKLNEISLSNNRKKGVAAILADLIKEGYLVAIATKNDESKVLALFDLLTEFPVKKESIFRIYANWGPKSESVRKVLETTGFQEDALLFIDDSSFECLEVKNSHPGIVAINISEQQNVGRQDFMDIGYFREKIVTKEDVLRESGYTVSTQLQEIVESSAKNDFLKSLKMKVCISNTDETNQARVQQMDERTNQFRANRNYENGTNEIGVKQIKVELCDNFTDYGVISILNYSISDEILIIHQWLMSCRIFSRGVEEYVLLDLIRMGLAMGVKFKRVQIAYAPTGRNTFFLERMKKLGFLEIENGLILSDFSILQELDLYIAPEL
jgi:FkbH-like protein